MEIGSKLGRDDWANEEVEMFEVCDEIVVMVENRFDDDCDYSSVELWEVDDDDDDEDSSIEDDR